MTVVGGAPAVAATVTVSFKVRALPRTALTYREIGCLRGITPFLMLSIICQ